MAERYLTSIVGVCFVIFILLITNYECGEILEGKFNIELDKKLLSNVISVELYSRSAIECSILCFQKTECCAASYTQLNSTCVLDQSEYCILVSVPAVGQNVMQKSIFASSSCSTSECVHFGSSIYKFDVNAKSWDDAKTNCFSLGGQLCEIESKTENNFIKTQLQDRNTGASGYWLGSYNFHEDITVVSNTNSVQVMTSTDMKSCEPNLPESQCCSCRSYPISWESYNCSTELPFICEFQTGSK